MLSYKLRNHDGLIRRCEKTIREAGMINPGEAVLIGVSGGPDSVALLHVLIALSSFHNYRLGIAHLNHGLRGAEAERDAQFAESLAKKHHLPYYLEKKDLIAEKNFSGWSLEEAGREARYRFFHRIAEECGYDHIAVGHHREDDAELILMNLIRGSGPTGIGGIRPVGKTRVIRPLIHAARDEILDFLHSREIEYVYDHTNDDTVFRRNHVRRHLIPSLKKYNPRIVETLNRLGEVLRTESQWIDSITESLLGEMIIERNPQMLVIQREMVDGLHMALRRRVIRRAIMEVKGDLRRIGFSHIDAIITLVGNDRKTAQIDLPDRVRVVRDNSRLILAREKKSLRSPDLSGRRRFLTDFEYRITREQAESTEIRIREINSRMTLTRMPREALASLPVGKSTAVDWECLDFPLLIRNAQPGDRFIPLGMRGTQKLKSFFINNKVPETVRGRIPLVVSGQRIIWIAGFRIDERVRISGATENILKIDLIPEEDHIQQACGGFRI